MRKQRNVKIIATLGPSSDSFRKVLELAQAGVDVFRLNASHGSHEDYRRDRDAVRQAEQALQRPLGILMDLQGQKLRIGEFASAKVELNQGCTFQLDLDPTAGNADRVCLPYPQVYDVVDVGSFISLDDGRVQLEVTGARGNRICTRVTVGGALSSRKSISIPDFIAAPSPVTDKDLSDIIFGLSIGVDWIALPSAKQANDVEILQAHVAGRARILCKLENQAAVSHVDSIVATADGIMVNRGDLGAELPLEQVPSLQKHILGVCRMAGKPVVIATQMLDSMTRLPLPTRAEVSDIANAAFEGADAVMLAEETAAGPYPVESVSVMDRTLATAERAPHYRSSLRATTPPLEATTADVICGGLNLATQTLPIAVVLTYTESGFSGLRAARGRPEAPILCLTPSVEVARQLTIVWGVNPVVISATASVEEMIRAGIKVAIAKGMARSGDPIAIAAGLPTGKKGTTNLLTIVQA